LCVFNPAAWSFFGESANHNRPLWFIFFSFLILQFSYYFLVSKSPLLSSSADFYLFNRPLLSFHTCLCIDLYIHSRERIIRLWKRKQAN
jgi:hypothetical protein